MHKPLVSLPKFFLIRQHNNVLTHRHVRIKTVLTLPLNALPTRKVMCASKVCLISKDRFVSICQAFLRIKKTFIFYAYELYAEVLIISTNLI